MASGSDKWMQNLDIRKGALRKKLGIKPGERIPMKKLLAAKKEADKAGDTKTKKQVTLALTFRKAQH